VTTMLEPITADELVGYFAAMLNDGPWGEPCFADGFPGEESKGA
jgi:hypothetical protein